MKRRDLETEMSKAGWYLDRHGARHDYWKNGKGESEAVPRHNEIAEGTARKILKRVKKNPG